jgi:hypothetical protein
LVLEEQEENLLLQVQEVQQELIQVLLHQHLCLLQAAVEVELDLLVQIVLVMVYQVVLVVVEQDTMYPHLQVDQELVVKEMLVELVQELLPLLTDLKQAAVVAQEELVQLVYLLQVMVETVQMQVQYLVLVLVFVEFLPVAAAVVEVLVVQVDQAVAEQEKQLVPEPLQLLPV